MSDDFVKGSSSGNPTKRPANSTKDGPPSQKKIAISLGSLSKTKDKSFLQKSNKANPLSIKLSTKQEKKETEVKLVPKSKKAAAVFNESSDSEPEEMPTEARMRMKNIGRNTPTSAGPNSFNKGRLGFMDTGKLWELQQKDLLGDIHKKDTSK
ncbi:PEST proteolytic signal-containing nuclear protein-like [Clavelina lepadiformis]|uniref:PEST proteolytic signal-containing nuclear protein n=1 Tax=Clavelina lepadiformis TaxID=159417 RepID=A0ABP0F3R0_CLALP